MPPTGIHRQPIRPHHQPRTTVAAQSECRHNSAADTHQLPARHPDTPRWGADQGHLLPQPDRRPFLGEGPSPLGGVHRAADWINDRLLQ